MRDGKLFIKQIRISFVYSFHCNICLCPCFHLKRTMSWICPWIVTTLWHFREFIWLDRFFHRTIRLKWENKWNPKKNKLGNTESGGKFKLNLGKLKGFHTHFKCTGQTGNANLWLIYRHLWKWFVSNLVKFGVCVKCVQGSAIGQL